jgi:hypothetical protein
MIDGYEHPTYGTQSPLCRTVINQRVGRIKRMLRWAASKKLAPTSVYVDLDTVDGLKQKRSVKKAATSWAISLSGNNMIE